MQHIEEKGAAIKSLFARQSPGRRSRSRARRAGRGIAFRLSTLVSDARHTRGTHCPGVLLPDKLQPLCNRVVGFTSIAEAAGVGGAFAGKSD